MNAQEVIGVLISLTAISSYLNYRYVKLPKSIGLTLVSLVLSVVIVVSGQVGWDADAFAKRLLYGIGFDETFLHGMLSFLLFAGSLHVNRMELAKQKIVVALLATVSVLLSTFIVGFCTYGVTQILGLTIPLEYCLVFGALISPTDPIATLGILKRVHIPKAIEMKIAGEALFNDGMGIVLFVVLVRLVDNRTESWTLQEITWFFLQQGVGGLVLGLALGGVAEYLLRSIDDYGVAIILTLAVVTGGYTLAHSVMHVSGAICMVAAGLVIGASLHKGAHMTQDTLQRLNGFWELVDEVLNAILFALIGLEFLRLTFTLDTILAGIAAIVITISARWVSVAIPVASVSLFRKFSPNVVLIMTWGGLRGGISIALALTVPMGPARDFIVAITYWVVLFSILVQGLTLAPAIRKLMGSRVPPFQRSILPLMHRPKPSEDVTINA